MKIVLAHNYYQQDGGEDIVFDDERSLLRANGHEVVEYVEDDDRIAAMGRVKLALNTVWSGETMTKFRALLLREQPDIVHFHNTFPLISPAAYYACHEAGVPIVQTLHNYRLLCPSAIFYRDGAVCEECLGKTPPLPAIMHACYRDSRAATGAVAAMQTVHRGLQTWTRRVDQYIVLTEFARRKFVEGGLPPEQINIKPNFVRRDPGAERTGADYMLFVGRHTAEKGVRTLLRAWQSLPDIPLKIVGDGPLWDEMAAFKQTYDLGAVEMLGKRSNAETLDLMKGARCLVFPSEWYETFGRVAIEAFACGLPVIAAKIGAIAELVAEGETGFHFQPGDAADLAAQVRRAWDHPRDLAAMQSTARATYKAHYTPDANYRLLMQIYQKAARGAAQQRPVQPNDIPILG